MSGSARARTRKRAFAFVAAALMLAVPLACLNAEDGPAEESDALIGWVVGGALILSAIAGGFIGYQIGLNDAETPADQTRSNEANSIATQLGTAVPILTTSFENYAKIWPMTSEHWTRQAELCTAAEWSPEEAFGVGVGDRILSDSGVYVNGTTMLANSGAQFNEFLDSVSDRVKQWGGFDDLKDGALKLVLTVGKSTVSWDSSDTPQLHLGSAARDVKQGQQAVYYAGGPIWSSASCDVYGDNGYGFHLNKGWNTQLDDPGRFSADGHAGVYTLPAGNSYLGYFQSVKEGSAYLSAGLVASDGDGTTLITYDGSVLSTDGRNSYSPDDSSGGIGLVLKGDGVSMDTVYLTKLLTCYHGLMVSVSGTVQDAYSATKAMWSVYSDMGESSAYLTTLTVPTNQLENVEWTTDQLKMINYLAMEQAADYYDRHSEKIKTSEYEMTKDSLTFFCRGSIDIAGKGGSVSATTGVAFTPILYRDYDLSRGTNTLTEYAYVVVWGKCTSLGGFDVTSYEDAQIMFVGSGTELNIAEMYYDGSPADEVHLEVSEMDWIDPEDIINPGPNPVNPENDLDELIRLVCFLIGAVLLFFGFTRGSGIAFIAGIALIGVGWFLAEPIETMIEDWTDARWLMPW